MDPQLQRSFIPKKPIVAVAAKGPSTINLFSLLSTVIFIVAIAACGGVFFYQNLLSNQIAADASSLDKAKNAFEPDLINQIERLNSRLTIGKQLLGQHVAVTPLFQFISSVTLKSVQFRSFEFAYAAANKITVTMHGRAASYASVALESDLLNAQKQLSGTLISNMGLEPAGTVSFDITTTIDPTLLAYSATVSGSGTQSNAAANLPAQTVSNTSTTNAAPAATQAAPVSTSTAASSAPTATTTNTAKQ